MQVWIAQSWWPTAPPHHTAARCRLWASSSSVAKVSESGVHPDVVRRGCCDRPPPTPPHCPVSCAPPAPGSTVRGSIFRMEKWEPGEVRRLARGHSWAPKVARDCSPMPSGPAPAALSVSPPGTHGAGQGGRQCGGPGSGGGRGAKSALSQAFFSPPAAPPGRTPCPQLPEPRQFLFLAPGAASCLSFELGCWFPTHSPSSNGPRACPLTGRPPGPAWRQTGTGGPRRPPLPGTSLPPFALLFSAPSGAAPGPVPDTPPPSTVRGLSPSCQGTRLRGGFFQPLHALIFQQSTWTPRCRKVWARHLRRGTRADSRGPGVGTGARLGRWPRR